MSSASGATSAKEAEPPAVEPHVDPQVSEKFSPEEEAKLVAEANATKTAANLLFGQAKYDDAIAKYGEAISVCPNYLQFELAVIRSNIAACHLQLEQWKEAIQSATSALDGLDKLEADEQTKQSEQNTAPDDSDGEVEAEVLSTGVALAARPLVTDSDDPRKRRKEDVRRIRAKALMRRARARSEHGGWQNLAGAEEDYTSLRQMDNLSHADQKIVQSQLRVLPSRTKAAQEKETAEMWGKLKDLGNGMLKPFGLSTDNFQMVKDEKTGGYSMNFQQGDRK